jgi:hypothetical protein
MLGYSDCQFVKRHFGLKTLNSLSRKGIRIIGMQALPDADGSFLNSETGYTVDDNGTGKVLKFREVLEAAR